MLETVLKIGKALRQSPNALRHHRYVESCPQDTDKRKILRLSLPVREDFSFDFNAIEEIKDENVIRDKLFYLKFKTSDADSLIKYIFGDIFYSYIIDKKTEERKEGGYYRLGDKNNKQKAFQKSSFFRGKDDANYIIKLYQEKSLERILLFRDRFEKDIDKIERILNFQFGIFKYFELKRKGEKLPFEDLLSDEKKLKELDKEKIEEITDKRKLSSDLFLHFDFQGKYWYEFIHELHLINEKLLEDFVEKLDIVDGYVLKKYLYKTLSSPEKDLQFPNFQAKARYRNKCFANLHDILDLFYAIEYSKTPSIKVASTKIKIIVLPQGNNLNFEHYENFLNRARSLKEEQENESIIREGNKLETIEQLFAPLLENVAEEIIKFDLIFSKQGGTTSPDVDLISLSGIEKSHLRIINDNIERVKCEIASGREKELKADKLKPLSILQSFYNIFSDDTRDKKKYQSHLYKILPKVFTGTYYNDPLALPQFIKKTEANIRADKENFNLLKYDFYFITFIQNTIQERENFMKIIESPSYQIGLLLGKLAKNFSGQNSPIKSFEKSYAGTLSRRINTLKELIKFKTFIEEKLVIHEKTFTNVRVTSVELSQKIKDFLGTYDKNECAFGFFESYFEPISQPITKTKQSELSDENPQTTLFN